MHKKHHGHHGHHKHHAHHVHHGHHHSKHHGYHSEHHAAGGPHGVGMGMHPYHEPHNPIMAMGGGGLHGPQGSYHDKSAGHGEAGGRNYGVAPGKCSGCMK